MLPRNKRASHFWDWDWGNGFDYDIRSDLGCLVSGLVVDRIPRRVRVSYGVGQLYPSTAFSDSTKEGEARGNLSLTAGLSRTQPRLTPSVSQHERAPPEMPAETSGLDPEVLSKASQEPGSHSE